MGLEVQDLYNELEITSDLTKIKEIFNELSKAHREFKPPNRDMKLYYNGKINTLDLITKTLNKL